MEKERKIDVSSASLIDLKAELFRKRQEFRRQKLSSSTNYIKARAVEKKPSLWSKTNTGVQERAQKDLEEKGTEEEEDALKKSRKALEAKTKLYDKISQRTDIPDDEDDGNELFLVDFQKKAIDRFREKQKEESREPSEDKIENDAPAASFPDEEWVEYTDSLGRSRSCLRKDLEEMLNKDKAFGLGRESAQVAPSLMPADMYREQLRKKWEEEEEASLKDSSKPMHYEHVRFNEIRTHGVGYFQFSKDEQKRQEQMDTLDRLRGQTIDERTKRNSLKERRKAMLAARLAKIKKRKMLKEGLLTDDMVEAEEAEISDEEIEPKLEMEVKKEELKPEVSDRKDSPRRNAPVREWDIGKQEFFEREKRYFEDQRNVRNAEFAPPKEYALQNKPQAVYKRPAAPRKLLWQRKKVRESPVVGDTDNEETSSELPLVNESVPLTEKAGNTGGDLLSTVQYHDSTQYWNTFGPASFTDPVLNNFDVTPHVANNTYPVCTLYQPYNVGASTVPAVSGQLDAFYQTQVPKVPIMDTRFIKNKESLNTS